MRVYLALPSTKAELESVCISGNARISGDSLSALFKSNPGLTTIRLCKCPQVNDLAVLALADNSPKLRSLDLESLPKVSERALIRLISRCASLTDITIDDCDVSDAFVDALARYCKRLKTARFHSCPHLTECSLLALITHNRYLTCLYFIGRGVVGTRERCSQLKPRPGARRLYVCIGRFDMTL